MLLFKHNSLIAVSKSDLAYSSSLPKTSACTIYLNIIKKPLYKSPYVAFAVTMTSKPSTIIRNTHKITTNHGSLSDLIELLLFPS